MINTIKITIYIAILGTLSTGIGGIIGGILKIKTKKVLSFLYEITSGIMTSIVCFEMLPKCFEITNIFFCILGILLGSFLICLIDILVKKFNSIKNNNRIIASVIMISMSFHNIIEGIAIGASFSFSFSLGITVLLSIFFHNIPEGMLVGITSKIDGRNTIKAILNSLICGAFIGFGCYIGCYIGNINNDLISFSLSIASGAMLYIVICDLIPEAVIYTKDKLIYITYILGMLIGIILSRI